MRDTGNPRVVVLDGSTNLPRELLGNKGYGINAMRKNGLPVPPAFCVTADVCAAWFAEPGPAVDEVLRDHVRDKIAYLQVLTGRTFGHGPRPLLVSVRSSAAQSMPGMLGTVLDLGINDEVEKALAELHGARFAADTRRRCREIYRRIVPVDDVAVPDDPYDQLRGAIEAVFGSWNSDRARTYRSHHGLDDLSGTAVVVQAMVFGNMDDDSGTGVLFSRNPITGVDEPFGEWLKCGQGDDVVSGTSDVESITALRDEQPAVYGELTAAAKKLEKLAGDVQDIEFTVEKGRLWLLQTRTAKRSAQAAVRIALALRHEGLIGEAETLRRVTPEHVRTLLLPTLQPEARLAAPLLAKGLPCCPGVATGMAYTDVDDAIDAAGYEDVILVRPTTSPDDIQGMIAARGIVTEIGGATSHAAVVSRELGRPSVVGCGTGVAARLSGKLVTIDGTEGEVREGILEVSAWSEVDSPELIELAELARKHSPLRAHTAGDHPRLNSSTKDEIRAAMAEGHTDVVSSTPLPIMLIALGINDSTRSDA
ncbi:pyruvate, phosphate dikinase [Mycobacterium sp. E2479]|uniref:pyruvate, phosphate dikinase n=1 Tax=Mycobacterium sp. E2479 TaxID=1834134 RepID=UPI0007FCB6F5|nr:pyruvate, phosphate dikinase [Mycobacterium sp. E2479]OBH58715.1 pyruvate, phosphate dikinase [Mycobacterium sp. E2479]